MSVKLHVKIGKADQPVALERSRALRLIGQGLAVAAEAPKSAPKPAKVPDIKKPMQDVTGDGA